MAHKDLTPIESVLQNFDLEGSPTCLLLPPASSCLLLPQISFPFKWTLKIFPIVILTVFLNSLSESSLPL